MYVSSYIERIYESHEFIEIDDPFGVYCSVCYEYGLFLFPKLPGFSHIILSILFTVIYYTNLLYTFYIYLNLISV